MTDQEMTELLAAPPADVVTEAEGLTRDSDFTTASEAAGVVFWARETRRDPAVQKDPRFVAWARWWAKLNKWDGGIRAD